MTNESTTVLMSASATRRQTFCSHQSHGSLAHQTVSCTVLLQEGADHMCQGEDYVGVIFPGWSADTNLS